MRGPASPTWTRLLCVLACGAGTVLQAWSILQLADAGSPASHVFGGLRWPVAALLATLLLASLGAVVLGRERWRLRVACRDLFVLAVAAIAAQVLLGTRFKPALAVVVFGFVLGVFGLLRLLDAVSPAWRGRRMLAVLDLVVFQLCLALVLLEAGLRTAAILAPHPLLARDSSGVAASLAMYRHAPGTLRYGFRVNSGGHYDEEFRPEQPCVVCIGDSFSISSVPHCLHYTTVCEQQLGGLRVHNLGRAGVGPGGYLWFLEHEALALRPRLVVISLFLGNDLMEASRWNNETSVLRSLCDRRNALAYQVPVRLLRMLRERTAGGALGGHDFLGAAEKACPVETSELAVLTQHMPWLVDPLQEPPTFTAEQFLCIEVERALKIHDADRHDAYSHLFGALDAILAAAGQVPLLVMLIPDQFQVDDDLWAAVCERAGRGEFDREQPQARVRAWLAARGVPCLDLLPKLREVEPLADGQRHLFHRHATHFNARGNRVAGEALAAFLLPRLR